MPSGSRFLTIARYSYSFCVERTAYKQIDVDDRVPTILSGGRWESMGFVDDETDRLVSFGYLEPLDQG
jgi:hypothetical protein